MEFFSETVRLKQWQAFVLLLMSGFATGTILAKLAAARGL